MKLEEIKERLTNEVEECLNNYNHECSDRAVEKILCEWWDNNHHIIEALSKHPNWDEDGLCVVVKKQKERDYEKDYAYGYMEKIMLNLIDVEKKANKAFADEMMLRYNVNLYGRDLSRFSLELLTRSPETAQRILDIQYRTEYLSRLRSRLLDVVSGGNSVLSENEADHLEYFKGLEKAIKPGQKKSRMAMSVFKKIGACEKVENFEALFAKLADCLSPKKEDLYFVISVHPVDYLLMSYGNSWRSCHMIDDGCYMGGTLSYMMDSSTMVTYTSPVKTKTRNERKLTRCLFMVSSNFDYACQSRQYPANSERDITRDWFQEEWSKCLGIENKWIKFSSNWSDFISTVDDTCHYRDYEEDRYRTMFRKGDVETGWKTEADNINIGHVSICPCCGTKHYNEEYLNCDDCRPSEDCDW